MPAFRQHAEISFRFSFWNWMEPRPGVYELEDFDHQGLPSSGHSTPATPQGAMIHCYDHPAWRERGGALLRHVVARYRDRPNLERTAAQATLRPPWRTGSARDLLSGREAGLEDGAFRIRIEPWDVGVLYCDDG